MDFLQRNANNQPQSVRSNAGNHGAGANSSAATTSLGAKKMNLHEPRWLRIVFVVLLFSGAILAVALTALLYFGKRSESHFVDKDRYQAVFLTNGQVYFGKIATLNGSYVNLGEIYYLNSQQQPEAKDKAATTAQTSFSLVKLGCELHGPSDQMIINREQVSFWENLGSDGKVAKAIDQWKAQNPNGQTCTEASNATQPTSDTTKKQ